MHSLTQKFLTGGLLGVFCLTSAFSQPASALERADVYRATGRVQLSRYGGRGPISAAVGDSLSPEDRLTTGPNESRAELLFYQDALIRQGRSTTSWFTTEACHFIITNGTALYLIGPGRGGCRMTTPEGVALARGTALFVQHNESTNTTRIGVLTNSPAGPVEVTGNQETETFGLRAGQIATIVDGTVVAIEIFDLQRFYATSELAVGLGPGSEDYVEGEPPEVREILDPVRAETLAALDAQEELLALPTVPEPPLPLGDNNDPGGQGFGTAPLFIQSQPVNTAPPAGVPIR